MTRYEYVIVGGGMIADAAAKGIRELDPDSAILVLGDDPDEPYTRPALSKLIWIDPTFTEDKVPLGTGASGAEIRTGVTVRSIDPEAKTVTVDGEVLEYGALLLATGGSPTTLDLPAGDRVIYFRTFADYRHLRELANDRPHVAVVGGSYIGTEIAAALVQNGCRVTLVTPDAVLREKVLPAELAERFQGWFEDAGVEILPETRVASGTASEDGVVLTTEDGSTIEADVVVLGLGIAPNTELAEAAGLNVEDGIVVDDHPPHQHPVRVRRRRRRQLPRRAARPAADRARRPHAQAGSARGPRDGGRRDAVHLHAVLLLDGLRPPVRGGRHARLVARHRRRLVGAAREGHRLLPRRRRRPGVLLWGNSSDAEPDARDGAKAALAEPTRWTRDELATRTLG